MLYAELNLKNIYNLFFSINIYTYYRYEHCTYMNKLFVIMYFSNQLLIVMCQHVIN